MDFSSRLLEFSTDLHFEETELRASTGGESMAGDAPRLLATPFLTKTYQLVDDHAIDDVISWNVDGSTFIVWNPTEFARDLLPKYFKHNNFSSFIRQLNTYGFRKVVPDQWEFSNDCFRRGEKKLLCDILRRKIAIPSSTASVTASVHLTPAAPPRTLSPSDSGEEQVVSSISPPPPARREFSSNTAELIGENERLRKENMQLNKELTHMKNLCNNIFVLVSNYSGSIITDTEHSCKLILTETTLKPLDLLPMTRFCEEMATAANGSRENNTRPSAEEISARLFGVPIGAKRGREIEGTSTEDEMHLQLQLPGRDTKYEPLDEDEIGYHQESSWSMLTNSRNQEDLVVVGSVRQLQDHPSRPKLAENDPPPPKRPSNLSRRAVNHALVMQP
ncbi:Heat stress transcription factor B-2b [Sesamum angolense]|uniref:Heat stress transcription factor B-2b n=1 Tax=Sesamum angolense TaxID=2727404 RepID=A0AAE2BZK8_9LAMI|nr:Heat stress transcription factor B-2b [Sesamum angolense]